MGKNTAPATYIAADVARQMDEDAIILVLPADHHIRDLDVFMKAIDASKTLAENGSLVTFGIVPGYAETGYGYIERGDSLEGQGGS